MKRVTLKSIAQAVNMSPSTVGLALGSADAPQRKHLKKETIELIEEKAREMGYAPHLGARMMRRERSNIIILLNFSGYTEIVSLRVFHLGRLIHEAGYEPLTIDAFWWLTDPSKTLEYVYSFKPGGVVVLGNPRTALLAEHFERLAGWGIPVVSFAISIPGIPSIRHDVDGAIQALTRQAIASGRRRIAFLTGGGEKPVNELSWQARIRLNAFRSVMAEHGVLLSDQSCYVMPHFSRNSKELQGAMIMRKRSRDIFGAYNAAHQIANDLFLAPVLPDAVLCGNDDLALCVITECFRRGIKVPEDIWICGFDNLSLVSHLTVPLTSVDHPTEALCVRTMEVLQALIAERNGAIAPRNDEHLVPCNIIWRESTGHLTPIHEPLTIASKS